MRVGRRRYKRRELSSLDRESPDVRRGYEREWEERWQAIGFFRVSARGVDRQDGRHFF